MSAVTGTARPSHRPGQRAYRGPGEHPGRCQRFPADPAGPGHPGAGRPAGYGGTRRVPGLRREEVALLAGVSVDYYIRLERGNLAGASEQVLEAVARALQLDEAERQHLFDLARPRPGPARRPRRPARVPACGRRCCASWTG